MNSLNRIFSVFIFAAFASTTCLPMATGTEKPKEQSQAQENSCPTLENKATEEKSQPDLFDTIISASETVAQGAKQVESISTTTKKLINSIPANADTETYFDIAKAICSCFLNTYINYFKEEAIQIKNIFEMKKEDLEKAKDDLNVYLDETHDITLAAPYKKFFQLHDLYQKALDAQKKNTVAEALKQELDSLAVSKLPTYLPQFIVNTLIKKFDEVRAEILNSNKQEAKSESNSVTAK